MDRPTKPPITNQFRPKAQQHNETDLNSARKCLIHINALLYDNADFQWFESLAHEAVKEHHEKALDTSLPMIVRANAAERHTALSGLHGCPLCQIDSKLVQLQKLYEQKVSRADEK